MKGGEDTPRQAGQLFVWLPSVGQIGLLASTPAYWWCPLPVLTDEEKKKLCQYSGGTDGTGLVKTGHLG